MLTASKGSENSYEVTGGDGEKVYGVFSNAFAVGCGYDFADNSFIEKKADANGDGVVTLNEISEYARAKVQARVVLAGFIQTVQVYPDHCTWFGVLR